MGLFDLFYTTIVQRNSIYVGTIIVGALAGEMAFHAVGDHLWEENNKGKLFKDLVAEKEAEE